MYTTQEQVATTAFTGVPAGVASHQFGASTAGVIVSALRPGVSGNALRIALVNVGACNRTALLKEGADWKVRLRHNGTSILATAAEVADAINLRPYNPPAETPFRASLVSTGAAAVAAAGATALAGGIDVTAGVVPSITAVNAGVFEFDEGDDHVVEEIRGAFSGIGISAALTVSVAKLHGGYPVAAGTYQVVGATVLAAAQWYASQGSIYIPKGYGLVVDIGAAGRVQVVARRAKDRSLLG